MQLDDTAQPAAGYLVKVFAEDSPDGKQPLARAVTDSDGSWSIVLQHAERAGELIHKAREKGQPELRIEVYEPEGRLCRQVMLSKDSDWGKPQMLEVTRPEAQGLIKRDLTVRGSVINCAKKLPLGRLHIEVWDQQFDQEQSLAEASLRDDCLFELRIPTDETFSHFKRHPVLWLRVRDTKDGTILAISRAPLAFDKNGEAVEELCLPEHLSTPAPVFNARKRIIELRLKLALDEIHKFSLAGIRTFGDAAEMSVSEVANRTGIEVGHLVLIHEFSSEAIAQLGRGSIAELDLGWLGLSKIKPTLPISGAQIRPIEDLWEYRFAAWNRSVDEVSAAQRYLDLLRRETGFAPIWRTQRLRQWLDDRQFWWQRYNIDTDKVRGMIEPCDSPFTYAKKRTHILLALGLTETGQDETGEGLIGSIRRCISDMKEMPSDEIHITTWTGGGENDGTDGEVLFNAKIYTQLGIVYETFGIPLGNRGKVRKPGQQDDYFLRFEGGLTPLLTLGEKSPTLSLKGRDGWRLNDWHIEVVHNGVSYTLLPSLASPVWLDSNLDTSWHTLSIEPWENPFTYWRVQLEKHIEGIKTLVRGLDGVKRFLFRVDDVLSLVLEGNEAFLLDNYGLAAQKYREAEVLLGQLTITGDVIQAGITGEKAAYDRLGYLLSLHIGDCYRGHHEYERAKQHFLTDACAKRNSGTLDDRFLWNKVAECELDWADHRYRGAGDDHAKRRYDYGSVEVTVAPIDTGNQYGQTNHDSAYALYSSVLRKGYPCSNSRSFDLRPSDSTGSALSDLLLLRAKVGVDSIDASLNSMGLHDDFVPAYRYNALSDWAQQAIADAGVAGGLYVNYKRLTVEAIDNVTAKQHSLAVADKNVEIGETLSALAQSVTAIAEGRIDAINNQLARLNEKEEEIRLLGAVQAVGGMLGCGIGVGSLAAGGSVLAPLALEKGFVDLLANGINTTNLLNDINREAEQLKDSKVLAEMEVEQASLGLVAQVQRNDIARLEADFLRDQLERAAGETFSNPEVWHQVSMIQQRLFFSAMARAVLACWRVQKAVEFEIEVGGQPLPIHLTDGKRVDWRPIRFDYLDTVLAQERGDGVYTDGDGAIVVSPLVAAITGAGRLQDDFEHLVLYRQLWYERNVPQFVGKEILLSRMFPFQLGQIQTTTGRLAQVHFRTNVKLFDEIAAGHAAYGRLFYVQAFYDAFTGDPNAFTGELTNSYVVETGDGQLVRNNLTYWRVPAPTSATDARYLEDWIDFTNSAERWALKAKPAAPTGTDADSVQVYNLNSALGQQVHELQRLQHLDFLNTFENTGLQTDWTLTLRIPTISQAAFSQISDIRLVFVWKASANAQLQTLINAQFSAGVTGQTYIRRFQQSPECQYFKQLFDPHNQYTDKIGVPGDRICFTILADGALPGQNRQVKSVCLAFVFDEAITPLANAPSLTARLTKAGIADGAGQPVEIVFTSPTQNQQPPFQLPAEFIDQDPAGAWAFQMLTNDNIDQTGGQPKSLHGLADIILVIEYEYLSQ